MKLTLAGAAIVAAILMLSVPARSALEMIYGNDSMRDKTFSREVSVQ